MIGGKTTMEEISVLSAGERFSFKGFDWITLGHTEDGGVLAIMDGCWKEIPFDNKRDYTNNYAKSTLRKTLLEELLPVLGEENLLPHVVDLVADNGDDSYGTVTDKVFILSCDEYTLPIFYTCPDSRLQYLLPRSLSQPRHPCL